MLNKLWITLMMFVIKSIVKVYYIIEQHDVNNYNNYIKLNDENEYINKIHYLFKESFKKLR